MASRVQVGKTVRVKGKTYKISRSNRKGKKYQACDHEKCVHFGAQGAHARPGTPKGDSYCARSYPLELKQKKQKPTPNDFARALWNCEGTKSRRS